VRHRDIKQGILFRSRINLIASILRKARGDFFNLFNMLRQCHRLYYKAGFECKDDEPPEIWFQLLKGVDTEYILNDYFGTTLLAKEDVDRLLDDYYDEHGWDKKTSLPTTKRLKELGLDSLVSDI
jgi:aldehyde:ferredoxin oxidoreductase